MRLPSALALGRSRARAGRDDDVLRFELGGLAVRFDTQLARRGQFALPHVDGDLVLLHQAGDALVELFGHPA
jgi:hypothetical protein